MSYEFHNHKNFTISEAIVKRVSDINNPDYVYDIVFAEGKTCQKSNKMTVGGVICLNCYIHALGKKMCSLSEEQRTPFIEYQLSIHGNPKKWFGELTSFVSEFEDAFDKNDFSLVPQWMELLENISEERQLTENKIVKPEYHLPEGFKLNMLNIKAEKLDIYQTAILFHLLREAGVIINYSNADLAKFAHYLTGHSEQNLRTDKGFSNIFEIMKTNRNGVKAYNLQILKKELQQLINTIDSKL